MSSEGTSTGGRWAEAAVRNAGFAAAVCGSFFINQEKEEESTSSLCPSFFSEWKRRNKRDSTPAHPPRTKDAEAAFVTVIFDRQPLTQRLTAAAKLESIQKPLREQRMSICLFFYREKLLPPSLTLTTKTLAAKVARQMP